MATQITIIGLGQIGASMGMALGEHKDSIFRVGHDKNVEGARAAQKKGAVDKIDLNLPSSVEGARLVVLCLPLSQVKDTFKYIAQDLMDGAVVLDTTPTKTEVAKWAGEYLPPGCHYVGLVPAINPELLNKMDSGLEAARADLFTRGLFAVDAPPGTSGDAIALASDFVRLLGATPLLADLLESDGLMAATHLLPQLLAATLLNATVDQPGWVEGRKVAGRAFAAGTAAASFQDEAESLSMAALQNREAIVHRINSIITSLFDLRDDIENGNAVNITERLKKAHAGRERWLDERMLGDWLQEKRAPIEVQSISERFLGTLFSKPKKKE
jgi:prephenate dehydrogenase